MNAGWLAAESTDVSTKQLGQACDYKGIGALVAFLRDDVKVTSQFGQSAGGAGWPLQLLPPLQRCSGSRAAHQTTAGDGANGRLKSLLALPAGKGMEL